ncbi:MAG: hypothetical protein IIA68_03575 [Proteobacteria bacterium]|nr:hypothetical protein [Pseudomonadota bacterium]
MPYVTRDQNGRIAAVHATQSAEATEKLAPGDPDLVEFLGQASDPAGLQDALVVSDLALVRVLEDLITVLIDKRIIMLTDLPKAAQQKLARRYDMRSRLADLGGIVAEHEDIPLP